MIFDGLVDRIVPTMRAHPGGKVIHKEAPSATFPYTHTVAYKWEQDGDVFGVAFGRLEDGEIVELYATPQAVAPPSAG
jgi:hypothetical protein